MEKTCVVCGKPFTAEIIWGQVRDTCSEKCRYQLVSSKLKNREIRRCVQCGKEFEAQVGSKKKLCSMACKVKYVGKLLSGENNPNWVETKKLRPSNKKSIIRHVKRVQDCCAVCGETSDLHVHHKDSNPTNNADDNLVLLCKVHHAEAHELLGENNLVGLILANRTYPIVENKECCICHKEFKPKRPNDICCSSKCAAVKSGLTRRKTSTLPSTR